MTTRDSQDAQGAEATDPVCGMQVDPTTAAGQTEYQGTTYYFCSIGCKRQFDRDLQRFVGGQSP